MEFKKLSILAIFAFYFSINSSFALVKLDDESIDIAIKYSIQMKNSPTSDILAANWINDGTGRILNIYTPFIQLVMKSINMRSTGTGIQDIKLFREKLGNKPEKIKKQNEVRCIISLYGDNDKFARNYKAYIVDDVNYAAKTGKTIKPFKSSVQKTADKDSFNSIHPYSAVNCYDFKYKDIANLKDYYFILVSDTGEEIKYRISNNQIF